MRAGMNEGLDLSELDLSNGLKVACTGRVIKKGKFGSGRDVDDV